MKRLFLIVSLCLSSIGMVFAQTDAQTVAMVNLNNKPEPVTVRQLKDEIAPQEQTLRRTLTVTEREQALEELIGQRLIIQAAERDKLPISPVDVDNLIKNNIAAQLGRQPTAADLNEKNRDDARKLLLIQAYCQTKKTALFEAAKRYVPSEADITYSFVMNRRELIRLDTVGVSLISIPIENDRPKAKAKADSLAREISANPARFDDIALPGKAQNARATVGFEAGETFLERNPELDQQMGKQFISTVFNLKQGEVSPLLETQSGFYFVRVNSIYGFKALELNDVVNPALQSIPTVRQFVSEDLKSKEEQRVFQQAFLELAAELRKERGAVTVYKQYLNW
jgi:parvulin-like peptidyl-prolyl isomerase